MCARQGIIVARHPLAAEAGVLVLEQGGNAFDAAVATGFALCVVEPYMSGIGGGKFQLVFVGAIGKGGAIDAPVVAPSGAVPGSYEIDEDAPRGLFGFRGVRGRANEIGHGSVAVPGVVAGLCLTLERFGTKSLEEVMQPAIALAEQGYPLSWVDIVHIAANYERLVRFPATAAIMLPNGHIPRPTIQYPIEPADKLVQSDLAYSLRSIAEQGPDVFYRGELGKRIVAQVQAGGGWLSAQDLASYKAKVLPVVAAKYRGWDLLTGPDFTVLEALLILERFDLGSVGHNSAQALHLIAEACLLVHADFYRYIVSPEDVTPDLATYLSAPNVQSRAECIPPQAAIQAALFPDEVADGHFSDGDCTTTGYSTADQWGNVVSVLQTHGFPFGSGVTVPGTGILLNDQMLGFNPEPGTFTSIAPGRTRPIPGWPIIGLKGDGSCFAIAAPGGNRVLCALVQVITNIIDFEMPIAEALAAPRVDCGSTPTQRKTIICDSEIEPEVIKALAAMGHSIDTASRSLMMPGGSPMTFAHPGGLYLDASKEIFLGSNDPMVPRSAVGFTVGQ